MTNGYSQKKWGYSFRGNNIRGGKEYNGRGRETKVCTHCEMTNYIIDTCFKKYDYPSHWQQIGTINNLANNNNN